jgi:multidrug resistance efflux pump
MTKTIVVRSLLCVLILAGGVGVMLALGTRPLKKVERPEEPPEVKTVAVQGHPGGLDMEIDGVVAPCREVSVAAEVPGRVVRKTPQCEAGEYVTKDTLLIEIDPTDYQYEFDRSQNQLQGAVQDLEENTIESENLNRLIRLAEGDLQLAKDQRSLQQAELERRQSVRLNAVSPSEIDSARQAVVTAEQAVVAAENRLQTLQNQLRTNQARRVTLEIARRQAEIQRDRAKRDLERTKVAAPVDGVIVREEVEADGYVQKGQPVFLIEDTSAVEVECRLTMED